MIINDNEFLYFTFLSLGGWPAQRSTFRAAMLCEFEVTIKLEGDGLLGGKHEYNPYIGMHATFGDYKQIKRVNLSVNGTRPRHKHSHHRDKTAKNDVYNYSDDVISYQSTTHRFKVPYNGEQTRVDEAVWFELFCHTRDSGIEEMDKRESASVERHISCGIYQLELAQIINTYKNQTSKTFKLSHPIVDDKIVEIKVQEYAKRDHQQLDDANYKRYVSDAMEETHKGKLTFEINMQSFVNKHFQASVYSMKNFKATSINATLPTKKPYKISSYKDAGVHQTEFVPISYTSPMGIEKMMHSLEAHVLTPYCQHFMKLNDAAKDPLYKPADHNVANLQLPMWVAKQGRLPVAVYWSCHDPSTREYHNEEERQRDFEKYGFTAKSEIFLEKILASSLRRHGMSAAVFEREIRAHFSTENKSEAVSDLFLLCEEVVADVGTFAANTAYYTSDYRFVRSKDKARMVVLDSWDNSPLNNIGNADDCEGQDNIATTVIRSFSVGRHTMGFQWQSSLLNAVKLYLSHSVIYDVGATVTSAYVDTNNQKIDLKQTDLPMVGDSVDLNSQCDGHCHGLMGSLTDAIARMEQGNLSRDCLTKVKAATINDAAFQKRDAMRRMLVLEPTGSIEPRILPVKEAYESSETLTRKKTAERLFMKSLRAQLETHKELGDMFVGEGMQHYLEKQDSRRRISSFYNAVVHASSVDLWRRFDITMSQFAFTRRVAPNDYRYGVKIADFIRTTKDYALIFPFNECGETWKSDVVPFIESVQHQLPIMSFARYDDENFAKVSTVQYNEKGNQWKQSKFEAMIEKVAENPNQSVVRLYSRTWKLQENKLNDFLSSINGLIGCAHYTEHQIPVCDPVVEILCIIDVTKQHPS